MDSGNYLNSLGTAEELMETGYRLMDFFNNQIEKIINNPEIKYQVKCRDNHILHVAKFKDKISRLLLVATIVSSLANGIPSWILRLNFIPPFVKNFLSLAFLQV